MDTSGKVVRDDVKEEVGKSDFSEDDCGKTLLKICAKGSAIIAELLQLSESIPDCFQRPEDSEDSEILCDFSYFRIQNEFDAKIRDSPSLQERDDAFQQTHINFLIQMFKLFKNIYAYICDLNSFIQDVKDGMYVSHTVDTVIDAVEGRQLLSEAFHLYAVMLLLLDYKIGGKTREYILVAYIRYQGAAGESYSTDIAQLCRSSGYVYDQALPKQYPVAYFQRVPVHSEVVSWLIARIRTEDMYGMSTNYPSPDHRCAAVATQGAILYTLLFFCPEVLESNRPVMREIVDKHFSDNWVINYYLGFVVDLTVAWRDFPAAFAAVTPTVQLDNVQYHEQRHRKVLHSCREALHRLLRESTLTENYVLDHIQISLLSIIRDSNVVLRWYILHGTRGGVGNRYYARYKEVYEYIKESVSLDDLIDLLLKTAQLEYKLREMFAAFLPQKKRKWNSAKEKAISTLEKLYDYFINHLADVDIHRINGTPVDTNEGDGGSFDVQLAEWFLDMTDRISLIKLKSGAAARRKLQKLIKALGGVEEYYQVNSNLHVLQQVKDAQASLFEMIRYINIENKVLVTITNVSDFSYAWERMSTFNLFLDEIQLKIRQNPSLALEMRAVFVKMSSLLELPCVRLDQASQYDPRLAAALEFTSGLYSNQLAAFTRKVLHVIPTAIFEILRDVVQLLTDVLQPCPTKFARRDLKEVSQLEVRARLSELTSDVSRYASGILAMDDTLIGTVHVDSHQLLIDGIRKELVVQITNELHNGVQFDKKDPPQDGRSLEKVLRRLEKRLQGIKQSFEYIQDFVYVNGHQVWLEEFTRILNFNVEVECYLFVKKKLYPGMSIHQSSSVPIPYFERQDGEQSSYSFLGKLLENLLHLTDPGRTSYISSLDCWVSRDENREERVGPRTFKILAAALGALGMAALDRLICFVTAKDLQLIVSKIESVVAPHKDVFTAVENALRPGDTTPAQATEMYFKMLNILKKDFGYIIEVLSRIGRQQLFRRFISYELSCGCQLQNNTLFSVLNTANTSFLEEVEFLVEEVKNRETKFVLSELPGEWVDGASPFLERAGIKDIFCKVYLDPILRPAIPELPLVMLATLLELVSCISYNAQFECYLPSTSSDCVDVTTFIAGASLLFRQFHQSQAHLFLQYISQASRVSVLTYEEVQKEQRRKEVLPTFGKMMISFLKCFLKFRSNTSDLFQELRLTHTMQPAPLLGGMPCSS